MSEVVDVPAVEVDPLESAIMTLTFSVNAINQILNLLGNELPFAKAVGLINNIQAQCLPQIEALQKGTSEPQAVA